jgi:hypothetical protein
MGILDPNFKYTDSLSTDIRKTFAKARQKLAEDKATQVQQPTKPKVAQLVPRDRRG